MAARRYLFVHGAWHGAWCFDLLRLELQRRAVECEAIDLPGLGDDETPPAQATFEAALAEFNTYFKQWDRHWTACMLGNGFGVA